jgi:hypothetical protein
MFGGVFIAERLAYATALSAILALGTRSYDRRQRRSIEFLASAFAIALVALQYQSNAKMSDEFSEILSCGRYLERDSTVLPVSTSHYRTHEPLEHVSSFWTMDYGTINLGNFSAYRGNHPLLFRESMAPLPSIGCLQCAPPVVNLKRYLETKQGQVDYVLAQELDLTRSLGPGYRLVCRSEPLGLAELFQAN